MFSSSHDPKNWLLLWLYFYPIFNSLFLWNYRIYAFLEFLRILNLIFPFVVWIIKHYRSTQCLVLFLFFKTCWYKICWEFNSQSLWTKKFLPKVVDWLKTSSLLSTTSWLLQPRFFRTFFIIHFTYNYLLLL